MATLKHQALVLTLANAYTRALGFALRLVEARWMGPQALGVLELASSAVMLAITPVTAGIPTAMSRLAAHQEDDGVRILASGVSLVKRLSLLLMAAMLLLSPAIAWVLEDMRTLPSLLMSIPTILLLGLCSVYSGWFYGQDDASTPALSECAEQTVRFLLSAALLIGVRRSVAVTAALPLVAETAAGIAVLLMFRRRSPRLRGIATNPAITREITRLTAPTTAARLCQTALRALNAVLLPACLRRSGLSGDAATAQFGLLGGMAMPLLMLPGIVTGAICMVATPAVSRREGNAGQLRRITGQLLCSGAGVGLLASIVLFFGADFFAIGLYKTPALSPLLRLMSPCALLMAIAQVQFGVITGLGLQNRALPGTVAASFGTLLVTAILCPMPGIRLYGAALGTLLGSLMRVLWNGRLLRLAKQRKI